MAQSRFRPGIAVGSKYCILPREVIMGNDISLPLIVIRVVSFIPTFLLTYRPMFLWENTRETKDQVGTAFLHWSSWLLLCCAPGAEILMKIMTSTQTNPTIMTILCAKQFVHWAWFIQPSYISPDNFTVLQYHTHDNLIPDHAPRLTRLYFVYMHVDNTSTTPYSSMSHPTYYPSHTMSMVRSPHM